MHIAGIVGEVEVTPDAVIITKHTVSKTRCEIAYNDLVTIQVRMPNYIFGGFVKFCTASDITLFDNNDSINSNQHTVVFGAKQAYWTKKLIELVQANYYATNGRELLISAPPKMRKIWPVMISLILLAALFYGCAESQRKEKERVDAARALQQQKVAAKKAEQKRFVEAKRAEDEASAAAKGMTYAEYKEAEQIVEDFYAVRFPCKQLVEKAAVWGVNWGGGENYKWAKNIKTQTIVLWGNDVRVKNAFNAERQASYACEYSMKSKAVTLRKFE